MQFILDDPGELIVRFRGAERFWALKKQIVLPRERIVAMRWHEQFVSPHRIWRVIGTGAPGALYAGRFRANENPYFVYIKRPSKGFWAFDEAPHVLEIEARNDGGGVTTILLSTSPEDAQTLLSWYNATK